MLYAIAGGMTWLEIMSQISALQAQCNALITNMADTKGTALVMLNMQYDVLNTRQTMLFGILGCEPRTQTINWLDEQGKIMTTDYDRWTWDHPANEIERLCGQMARQREEWAKQREWVAAHPVVVTEQSAFVVVDPEYDY
jgi:hypothetical protein